ncbi:putative ZRT2-zinc transporter II [Testicularia cyperi]|uniref:Putative ZRT2-zinc transporter II n=1 Tax=Testicularia cyperi TaxID=1882483 RepID=A0A317XXG4_9BASI|nr:putative ZRT2-zinc transporter II [Testicularia cyperi]
MADAEQPSCSGPGEQWSGSLGLRIGAIFILWASATAVTLFPIVTRRVPRMSIPREAFDFAKYFGSGVIIATAFIHLLEPGVEALQSPCLAQAFQDYSAFPFAIAMIALFAVFIVELFAYRLGSKLANKLAYDPHTGGHHHALEHTGGSHPKEDHAHSHHREVADEEADRPAPIAASKDTTLAKGKDASPSSSASSLVLSSHASEILGVLILEFGVIFHSVIIGITLGTTTDFNVLFIVIIFHQMFEGLGLGSRLAFLPLKLNSWIPFIGALAYGLVTPIGLAIGLGIRGSYNEESATANYVSGIFDSVSAGILLYTGTVELLAHEFIFNERIRTAPLWKVSLSVAEMLLGAGLMALLGRWA